jgi:hypothetical protein
VKAAEQVQAARPGLGAVAEARPRPARPAVKAALEKRNKAIQEYRAALRASMIKSDATVAPILDKVRF